MTEVIDVVDQPDPAKIPEQPGELLARLRGPTIFRVAGRDRGRARVVAGGLHGNEPSGFRAIHRVLRSGEQPAVNTAFFIGAVDAARAAPGHAHRMLPGRRDLNRCFRPPFDGDLDGRIAGRALELLRAPSPEAVIDLHNNTGHNPVYGVGARLDPGRLQLCALFAPRYICSRLALGTFAEAFEDLAPSITIECGRAGDPSADEAAHAGLLRFLRLEALSAAGPPPPADGLSILEDPVRVTLVPGSTLAFGPRPDLAADLTLDGEIDRHNFQRLAAGTLLGWVRPGSTWPLVTVDASGADLSRALFTVEEGTVRVATPFVPVMMTTDPVAAQADCLFYAVRRP